MNRKQLMNFSPIWVFLIILISVLSCKSKNELEVKQKLKDDCFIFLNNGEYYQAFKIADDQINIDSNDLEF